MNLDQKNIFDTILEMVKLLDTQNIRQLAQAIEAIASVREMMEQK